MESNRRLALLVGSFLVGSLLLLAGAILTLTSERGIFTRNYELIAHFENVQGLLAGAPVWLAGKEVGRVDEVRFAGSDAEEPLTVVLRIDLEVQPRIRADSVASIGTIGVLGDSYVEISVGGTAAQPLADGAQIRAETPASLGRAIATGTKALDNITELTSNLNEVVAKFSADEGGAKAAGALEAVSDIMIEVREGKGALHSLIYDEYQGQGLASVERALASFDAILQEVRTGDGLLHELVYEDRETLTSLDRLLTEFGSILREVREGEGLVHGLIYDEAGDNAGMAGLLEAGETANRILTKLDDGEGTLGLMINDPSLYEDLRTLLAGAQRSTVLRTLIRMAVEAESE